MVNWSDYIMDIEGDVNHTSNFSFLVSCPTCFRIHICAVDGEVQISDVVHFFTGFSKLPATGFPSHP